MDVIQNWRGIIDIFISEMDAGVYAAMNKGVRQARGKYVCFLNGDDELVSHNFQKIIKILTNENTAIVCASAVVVNLASEQEIHNAKIMDLPYYNSIPHISSFVPRSLLLERPFREDLRIASDYDFFLHSLLLGLEFKIVNIITGKHYRGGISSNTQLSAQELKTIQKHRLKYKYAYYRVSYFLQRIYRKFLT